MDGLARSRRRQKDDGCVSIEIDVPLGTVADRQRVHRPFGFNREIPFYFAKQFM